MHAVTFAWFLHQLLPSMFLKGHRNCVKTPSAHTLSNEKASNDEQIPSCVHKNLGSLPPELHHMIASHLTYPDLLSLKLTSNYFSGLIGPKLNVKMRVHWVRDRCDQYLPVPKGTKLSFRSDASFVANAEVNAILRRRRKHKECVDYDKDHQKRFEKPILALELGERGGLQYIQVRGRIRPSWSKACLVTGKTVCPSIEDLELKKQHYERSLLGKACSYGQTIVSSVWFVWWWLVGFCQTTFRPTTQPRNG